VVRKCLNTRSSPRLNPNRVKFKSDYMQLP